MRNCFLNAWRLIAAACCLTLASGSAHAILLEVTPSFQIKPRFGAEVTADIVISGLGNEAAPSLSAFDIELNFDSRLLAFESVTFGDYLSIFDPALSETGVSVVGDRVSFFELSLNPAAVLDELQPDAFIIATLNFITLNVQGVSPLDFGLVSLRDGSGNLLEDVTTLNGRVRVPVSGTLTLVCFGLAGLGACRARVC